MKLPELLCPAGSMEALAAAIDAGADAVYFGGTTFNARMFANNFDEDGMRRAVELCHTYGVKAYVTLNTLALDREMREFLRGAEQAYRAGADALIVADLGGASAIRRTMPEMELHASTQVSGHNTDAGRTLASLGFSRMVCAREMPLCDLASYVKASPIESEVFIHGALCVCHSGQCLFSSMVGGRSGNRGTCAQPCRLPYRRGRGKTDYPLSLKDLCLGGHVRELIDAGVSSLKIEGRMKTPEYVYAVTRIWRRLLNERRDATPEEMQELAAVFSRGGFTDRYFTVSDRTRPGALDDRMLGVRSEADKARTSELSKWTDGTAVKHRKLPLTLRATFRAGVPAELCVTDGEGRSVTVTGAVPEAAIKAPMREESVSASLGKLGATPYFAEKIEMELDEGLMLPASAINELRRAAIEALTAKKAAEAAATPSRPAPLAYREQKPAPAARKEERSARFASPEQITPRARAWFDHLYLPLAVYDGSTDGVILPSVLFDSERAAVEEQLAHAVALGAKRLLVGNIGHLPLAQAYALNRGLSICGDFRLNVTNSETARVLFDAGLENLILSPELSLSQLRDIPGACETIVYGRIPLMLLERCVIRTVAGCEVCRTGRATLTDRTGASFPVLREFPHRNIVYNSIPTYMADRQKDLDAAGLARRHFIFSIESPTEVDAVLRQFDAGKPAGGAVRRIK